MFQQFEEIAVKAGDVIIREGDAADFYYVIKDGAASVTKKLETGSAVVAYLVRGDTFGEDALLANTLRNATVTMIKEGKLMRLSKKAFEEVMKPPAIDWLSPGMASIMARQGAVVVDVRMKEEHARRAIKDAISVPLYTCAKPSRTSTSRRSTSSTATPASAAPRPLSSSASWASRFTRCRVGFRG
jgi:cAMP-binding proteins - catabolite gene activator and regulatory subunit of cAMP-dependent protein kinases